MNFKTMAILLSCVAVYSSAAYGMNPEENQQHQARMNQINADREQRMQQIERERAQIAQTQVQLNQAYDVVRERNNDLFAVALNDMKGLSIAEKKARLAQLNQQHDATSKAFSASITNITKK